MIRDTAPPMLFILDPNFNRLGAIINGASGLNYSSLEWRSVFHKPDAFLVKCPVADSRDMDMIMDREALYIIRSDTLQVGRIWKKEFDLESRELEISGKGAESFLTKRYIANTKEYIPDAGALGLNAAGRIMARLINDNSPPGWLVANETENEVGESIYLSVKNTKNVLSYIEQIAKAYDVGFGTVLDERSGKVIFKAYRPLSIDVDVEGRTYRLSDDLGNIKSLSFATDSEKYFNYISVLGEADPATGIEFSAIVDQSAGGEVHAMRHKGKTKRRAYTDTQYAALLQAEGVIELSRRRVDEAFEVTPKEGTAEDRINIAVGWEVFCQSYFVNMQTTFFCTELKELWENIYSREYTFGYRRDMKDEFMIEIEEEIINV
ncbi:MAG: siphovirus ReqiPepy6 Gp37-like family protein [Desulfovibrionaceae bacterium]|nr:siphovirus ReqiPepy6 Gp37-like family protein [Desulfovibrionaceae bacterium]